KSELTASSFPHSASAFAPSAQFMGSRVAAPRASSSAMKMDVQDMPGVLPPTGFFDPLEFCKGADAKRINFYREAELKHGRVAMLAVTGVLTQEFFHPLYNGSLSTNPVKAASEVPFYGWVQILFFIGFIEFVSLKIKQSTNYQPGDYLGASDLMDESDPSWVSYQTKELQNGRLAMLAIMGEITHAIISGQPAIEQI
ncbi:unnamed protein product, partial [Chrysoparadoxa australica]